MFAGLVLTSISTVMMRAALFQRKSRSGWLEELDGIREDALEEPGAGADVVQASGIWTDLRDGGEYADPHEIASLYATDATPDLPVTTPVSKTPAKTSPRGGWTKAKGAAAPPPPPASADPVRAEAASALPVAEALPPSPAPPAPQPETPLQQPAVPIADDVRTAAAGMAAPGSHYDDQIWVQPAPHPIRPSEMWHPAELAPMPLGEESFELVAEEWVASADLMDPTYNPRFGAVPTPEAPAPVTAAPTQGSAVADARTAAELEGQLAADGHAEAPAAATPPGRVNGPIGRQVRRDRPAERPRAVLPPPEGHQPLESRGEQSPLPTHPLPPAALPTRSNRLPGLELPATPGSVVPPRPVAAPAAPQPVTEVAPEPVIAAPEPVVAPASIAIGADGLVAAPGTIVRIGGNRRARAAGTPDGVIVSLDEGWCWVAPSEGDAAPLRIELPAATLALAPGATALAIVDADGSVFILVAAGDARLEREGDGAAIGRGTIIMIDPSGAAQSDAASDAEIESDPIVAENLALDAEL